MNTDFSDQLEAQWRKERPDLDSKGTFALYARLARLVSILETELATLQQEQGFARGELDVLATLRRSGPPYSLTPTELYRSMLLSSGAMTSRIDRLVKKGWVERTASHEDRRSNRVSLSEPGKEKIDAFLPLYLAREKQLLTGLSDTEQAALSDLLRSWTLSLQKLNAS